MSIQTGPSGSADLSGKRAIVTGAGSGIGRATALSFARCGAQILVNDIIADRAHNTVAMIEQDGGRAMPVIADVSDEQAVKALVDEAIARLGGIDIVVNNAGIMDEISFLEDVPTELWNRVFAVNVNSVFFMLRAVLPHMRAAGSGTIVNIASEAGLRGGAAGGAYVSSKHAVVGLTRSVAWSHANEGIRCNAICPGAIDTDISGGRGMDAYDQRGLARALPIMRLCERISAPEAIANAALFLASDSAFFVNGAIMPVDGGWLAG